MKTTFQQPGACGLNPPSSVTDCTNYEDGDNRCCYFQINIPNAPQKFCQYFDLHGFKWVSGRSESDYVKKYNVTVNYVCGMFVNLLTNNCDGISIDPTK